MDERSVEEILGRSLRVLGALTFASALTSATFFHPDEHFQIVEFAGLKLGFTPPEALPWEFSVRMRAWLQPALYTLLARPLVALGVEDRGTLLTIFRLVTGVGTFASLRFLSRVAIRELPREAMRRAYAAWLPLVGFLPYLLVRTSSEAASGALLAGALALAWDARAITKRRALGLGVLLGLAFEARFQSAFAALGTLAWLVVVRRVAAGRFALVVLGGLVSLAIGALVDRWGYGVSCFPALAYVRENVVHGAANAFGREPFWAYPILVVANVFAPTAALAVLAVVVASWRFPRHPLVWSALPFVVAHALVAHKEERFLFPLVFLVPGFLALAFGDLDADRAAKRWVLRALLASMPALAAHLVHPIGFRAQFRFVRQAASLPSASVLHVAEGVEVPWYPFLAARPFVTRVLGACVDDGALVYGERPEPDAPPLCSGAPASLEIVATDLVRAESTTWRHVVDRFTVRWNRLRDAGAPLPWLRFATIVRVHSARTAARSAADP